MASSGAYSPEQLDQWAGLSHKAGIADQGETPLPENWVEETWIPEETHRRRAAYKVLFAYANNNARRILTLGDPEARKYHREYNDAGMMVVRRKAGILGDSVRWFLPELQQALQPAPAVDDGPDDPGSSSSDLERLRYEAELEVWTEEKTAEIESWRAARGEVKRLRLWDVWLQDWVDKENVEAVKGGQEEKHTIPLGDGVLTVLWSPVSNRPVITAYDPAFYIPDPTAPLDPSGFPTVVHFIWEETAPPKPGLSEDRTLVRRITFALVDTEASGSGTPLARRYAYAPEVDSFRRCLMTDVTFDLADVGDKRKARKEGGIGDATQWPAIDGEPTISQDGTPILDLDLAIDFIPVEHDTNDTPLGDGFGTSALTPVVQIFDDISAADTDLTRALAIAGTPMAWISGASLPVDPNTGRKVVLNVQAGQVWDLGENGTAGFLDASASVDALLKALDSLQDRLAVNGATPDTISGRFQDFTTNASGIFLRLSWAPFDQAVNSARLARRPKYRLLPKMAARIAIAANPDLYRELGELPRFEVEFGSYTPDDIASAAETAAKLANAGAASRETTTKMLKAAGVPITDVAAEVIRIGREDTTGAKEIAEALRDEVEAAKRLGAKLPDTTLGSPATAIGAPAAIEP